MANTALLGMIFTQSPSLIACLDNTTLRYDRWPIRVSEHLLQTTNLPESVYGEPIVAINSALTGFCAHCTSIAPIVFFIALLIRKYETSIDCHIKPENCQLTACELKTLDLLLSKHIYFFNSPLWSYLGSQMLVNCYTALSSTAWSQEKHTLCDHALEQVAKKLIEHGAGLIHKNEIRYKITQQPLLTLGFATAQFHDNTPKFISASELKLDDNTTIFPLLLAIYGTSEIKKRSPYRQQLIFNTLYAFLRPKKTLYWPQITTDCSYYYYICKLFDSPLKVPTSLQKAVHSLEQEHQEPEDTITLINRNFSAQIKSLQVFAAQKRNAFIGAYLDDVSFLQLLLVAKSKEDSLLSYDPCLVAHGLFKKSSNIQATSSLVSYQPDTVI